MGTIQDARGVLANAEASLRQLMESALREQRYVDVAEIAGLADGVARLSQGRAFEQPPPVQTVASPVAGISTQGGSSPMKIGKLRRNGYPRFECDGGKLVKIGWSKKNTAAYEHRAPREAVVAFVRQLSGSVAEGKVFAVEDVLPVPDLANGGEIPAYQVYLTLAWLRDVGAIAKKGRDGYLLRRGGLANGALEKFWASLPARTA